MECNFSLCLPAVAQNVPSSFCLWKCPVDTNQCELILNYSSLFTPDIETIRIAIKGQSLILCSLENLDGSYLYS